MEINKLACYDIETLKSMFLFMAYDVQEKEWIQFGVWNEHNSLDRMYKYYEKLKREKYHLIGFNSLSFDSQVMEFILRNNQEWWNKTNKEILKLIYDFSQNVINDNNYDIFPPYRESELFVSQIDIFKIAHYDNENKRTSLKWLEYTMDMPSIEDMPITHTIEYVSEADVAEIIKYCKNDVESTYRAYQYFKGDVEHEFYRGRDQIQDRVDLINELGFSDELLNYSDVKIGDELNKKGYCRATNRTPNQVYDLKRNRRPTKRFTFGDCIPDYVKFTTPEFNKFYESVKKERVKLMGEEQEYPFRFNDTTYTIARGGIHSNESYRIVSPKEDEIMRDCDVGSQHPRAISKRGLYPSHLGIAWNRVYNETILTRISYKERGKTDRKYKGLAEMYKKALNAGGFGMTNLRTSWQYDPVVTFSVTIGNEFEILLLIEMMETNGIHCISANTDGIVCLFNRELSNKYYDICHEWERIVGNEKEGKLEYQEYTKLIQESVNSYYAIKPDGSVKKKGRLEWEVEIHMNNSNVLSRIERKALFYYFTQDVPIRETIEKENNLYMFCIGKKASSNYRFEAVDRKKGICTQYTRILRYYISKEGFELLKVRRENADTSGYKVIQMAEGYRVTVANDISDDHRPHFDNINYDYYIKGAEEARDFILRKGKIFKPRIASGPNQLNLFT